MAKADVAFTGDVITLHVKLDGGAVNMRQTEPGKWSGSRTYTPNDPTHVDLRFTAPVGTDWALTVKLKGDSGKPKKILDEDGTSGADPYTDQWDVPTTGGVADA